MLMVFFSMEREVGRGWWDVGWCKTVKLKEKAAKTICHRNMGSFFSKLKSQNIQVALKWNGKHVHVLKWCEIQATKLCRYTQKDFELMVFIQSPDSKGLNTSRCYTFQILFYFIKTCIIFPPLHNCVLCFVGVSYYNCYKVHWSSGWQMWKGSIGMTPSAMHCKH